MSGHSHWAKIKRAKGANDAKRGKVWSKIARKIIIAARAGGGDPGENLTLRYIIEEGKSENMPKDTILKAIAKGTGELGGENFESAIYEGYGPGGVAFIVEALTNNRARTAPEMRKIFELTGGNLATSGSVGFQFIKTGILPVKAEGQSEDRVMELALEAGADDVVGDGEYFEVRCAPQNFIKVKEGLAKVGLTTESALITYLPQNTVKVEGELAARVLRLLDTLDDHEDVQNVAHNAELPEEAP